MTRMGTPRRQAKKTGLALLAALVLALAALPGAAFAVGTLDQQQTDASSLTGYAIFDSASPSGPPPTGLGLSIAQTFTAGISGGLDQVDLNLFQFATLPLTVEIRTVDGAGAPTETVLATAVVPASSVPDFPSVAFVAVPFAQPAPVVAGTQYAIVLYTAEDPGGYGWRYASGDVYAGGEPWSAQSSPPTTSWQIIELPDPARRPDAAFKTYVTSVAPVAPTSKSQCKKGGWHSFSQFKNQGQCVSSVVHQRT